MNADHTVTAIVQISYSGDRDAFAWIVPVPGVPVLDASTPELVLNALAQATDPQYFKQQCSVYNYAGAFSTGGTTGTTADAAAPPVTVLDQKLVGPYETVTLAATTAADLVDWLQTHQYRITDEMIPVLQPYIENGLHFVALRLQADRTAEDVTPLTMTYQSDKPMIPIRLTRIAAQPEMGIVTWILADRRWAPENYVDLKIPDSLIEFDQNGYQNNYLKVVSEEVDKVGGQAFVTEYAKGTGELVQQVQNQFAPTTQGEEARQRLLQLLQSFPYITRMYTRMSAEEMIGTDPTFVVASNQIDVSNIHDLTDPGFDYSQCNYTGTFVPPPAPDPCFLTYCGRRGVCAPTAGNALLGISSLPACVCADDATARPTTTAYGMPIMYCEPVAMDLGGASAATVTSPDAGAAPLFSSGCDGFSCGAHGECVAMNGNPTCHCEAGYGAVAQQVYDSTTGVMKTTVTCESVGSRTLSLPRLPRIGQPNVYDSPGTLSPSASGGCAVGDRTSSRSSGLASTLALGLSALLLRRRRSR